MPVTTPKKLTYSILLPDIYPITKEKLEELQKINPDLELSLEKENILNVTESSFLFEDYGYFGVKLPGLNYKIVGWKGFQSHLIWQWKLFLPNMV